MDENSQRTEQVSSNAAQTDSSRMENAQNSMNNSIPPRSRNLLFILIAICILLIVSMVYLIIGNSNFSNRAVSTNRFQQNITPTIPQTSPSSRFIYDTFVLPNGNVVLRLNETTADKTIVYKILKFNRQTKTLKLLYEVSNKSTSSEKNFYYLLNPKISSDGKYLAFLNSVYNYGTGETYRILAELMVVDLDSGEIQKIDQVSTPEDAHVELIDYNWSPNGQVLGYILKDLKTTSKVKIFDHNSKQSTNVSQAARSPLYVTNSKEALYVDEDNKNIVKVNAAGAKSSIPIQLKEFPKVPAEEFGTIPALIPNFDNSKFIVVSKQNEMFILSTDSMRLNSKGTSRDDILKAGWSPKGTYIAFITLQGKNTAHLSILNSQENLSKARIIDRNLGELALHTYGITDDFVWSPNENYLQFTIRLFAIPKGTLMNEPSIGECSGGGPHPSAKQLVWSENSMFAVSSDCKRNETIFDFSNGSGKKLNNWTIGNNIGNNIWFGYTDQAVAIVDNQGKEIFTLPIRE